MEIIRRDTDYAIRALVYLAQADTSPVSCTILARAADAPKPFAHKILKKLVDAGLVTSCPGRSGGFVLRKPVSKIPLKDVVEAIQGPTTVSRCVLEPEACRRSEGCPVSVEWCKLQETIESFLSETTLEGVLADIDRSGP